MQTTSCGRYVSHKLQATSHRLNAALFQFPGRGRLARPRSGAHAARATKTLSPSSRSRHRPVRHELRATGHPATINHDHEPSTTHQQGGHAGPPLRREKPRAISREPQPQLQATSHRPRATSHGLAQNELRAAGYPVKITTYHAPRTTYLPKMR